MKRERWTSRPAFVLATIGSAVGLGNIWRFPYIAYKNGGGAFLIPYFVALIFAGIPLLIMETGLGQRMQGSAAKSFAMISKRREWLGWFAIFIGTVICSYYAIILSWSWSYLFSSVTLAWADIGATDFFMNNIINISSGPFEFGVVLPRVFLGVAVTWIIVWVIIAKGVRTLGRFNQIILPVSFIILLTLLIRGVTLPGAMTGLSKLFNPDFSKLTDPRVWLEAFSQIFFTLSLGFGILIAYASYRDNNEDITNNANITGFANGIVEFFAGITVFSTVGFLAFSSNVSMDSLSLSGPGLAFMTYPEAISKIPGIPHIFGILFFSMLLFLGLTSLVSLVEAVVTGLKDKFGISRMKATSIIIGINVLLGILYATRSGLFWLDIVDHWILSYGLVVVGLLEAILVGWIFGADKLKDFSNSVSERALNRFWEICIKYIVPGSLIILLIFSVINEFKEPYGDYPLLARILGGWFVVMAVLIASFVIARARDNHRPSAEGKYYLVLLILITIFYWLFETFTTVSWGSLIFFFAALFLLVFNIGKSIYIAIRHEDEHELEEEVPPPTM
ncbi:MAG: sodium-dependent transporter [bacterium]